MIKENQIAVSGRVGGVWNKETNSFEVRSGLSKNGIKYQIFNINVSKKIGETWSNGKGLKVMLWGDDIEVKKNNMIGILGRLQPDNWTNRDGVNIKGMSIVADVKDIFVPDIWEKKSDASSTSNAVPLSNDDFDLPF